MAFPTDDRAMKPHSPICGRRRLELTIGGRSEQDQHMTFARGLGRILVISALAFCTTKAMGDSGYVGQPLTQTDFNRLVPTSYPLVTTQFSALKPTTDGVSQTGVARIHPTDNLVHPIDKPLLHPVPLKPTGVTN